MAKKKSLYDRALGTVLHSRFVARAEDLGRDLTDDETREEARYQLEDLPYKVMFEDEPEMYRKAIRQMKALLR